MDESAARIDNLKIMPELQLYAKIINNNDWIFDTEKPYEEITNPFVYRGSSFPHFKFIWLPRIDQHLEILKEKYAFMIDMFWHDEFIKWEVNIDTSETLPGGKKFEAPTLEQCLDMACEFVLSKKELS